MHAIAIQLFGAFAVRRSADTQLLPMTRKAQALLVILATAGGQAVSRDRICTLLWGDRSDEQARQSLSQALSTLRRVLGANLVVADRNIAALAVSEASVDIDAFTMHAKKGDREALAAALVILTGQLLPAFSGGTDAFDTWLQDERRRFDALAIEAMLCLGALSADTADWTMAYAAYGKALMLDPAEERAHTGLMRLHIARGSPAAALRQFDLAADILAKEVDVPPSLEMHNLRALARSAATGTPPQPRLSNLHEPNAPVGRRPSVAVLPFQASADLAPLSRGLVDDIISGLARLRSLFVIGRGTTFALHEADQNPRTAARELGVDYVCSGRLRQQGDTIEVSVEVATGDEGFLVSSERYAGPPGSALVLRDQMALQIVAAIDADIVSAEGERALHKPIESLGAWEIYHRGVWHVRRYRKADNEAALLLLNEVVQIDPGFSRAHAYLSLLHFQSAYLYLGHERDRAAGRALDAAADAITSDSRDPAGHWALGRAIYLRDGRDDAIDAMRQSISLGPSSVMGHYGLGYLQSQYGDPTAALAALDTAVALSPHDPLLFGFLASRMLALLRLGRGDEAADMAAAVMLRPNAHMNARALAAATLALNGRLVDAARAFETVRRDAPGYLASDVIDAFRMVDELNATIHDGLRRIGVR